MARKVPDAQWHPDDATSAPKTPTPAMVDLAGLKVLVADDVADSGDTLVLVGDLLRPHVADLRTAVLYHKPWSVVAPDYSWAATEDWIHFPWDEPPVTLADKEEA